MITEDQTAIIDFLASPSAHGGASVERIDTHASAVLLAGERACVLYDLAILLMDLWRRRLPRHANVVWA